MNKKTNESGEKRIEFDTDLIKETVSSSTVISPLDPLTDKSTLERDLSLSDIEFLESMSPESRELALPKLPRLDAQDHARLQMQSPNKLFFYWSLKANPFQQFRRSTNVEADGYQLVLKLADRTNKTEMIYPIERSGSWWFDVKAGTMYQAEVGLYAVNRPFVRILFSNIIQTPRKNPSPQSADSAEWHLPADKFAEVLKISGFAKDAFDVAVAGDNDAEAKVSSYSALAAYTGNDKIAEADLDPVDIRFALYGIASGLKLDDLRWQISDKLFELLQQQDSVDNEKALKALRSGFNVELEEFIGEETGSAVFGSSSVNFPRRIRTRVRFTEIHSFSSHSLKH